jgi:5-formyltetrahydrofolate cyclo-ligase
MANQRGGSEWEPIKILLEGDGNSNKMNAASNTCLRLTTQVRQAHVATGVPLDLGTNTEPSIPRTQRNTKPRVYIPTPVRPVSTTGQTGPYW